MLCEKVQLDPMMTGTCDWCITRTCSLHFSLVCDGFILYKAVCGHWPLSARPFSFLLVSDYHFPPFFPENTLEKDFSRCGVRHVAHAAAKKLGDSLELQWALESHVCKSGRKSFPEEKEHCSQKNENYQADKDGQYLKHKTEAFPPIRSPLCKIDGF